MYPVLEGLRIWGLGFEVQGLEFRVQGLRVLSRVTLMVPERLP